MPFHHSFSQPRRIVSFACVVRCISEVETLCFLRSVPEMYVSQQRFYFRFGVLAGGDIVANTTWRRTILHHHHTHRISRDFFRLTTIGDGCKAHHGTKVPVSRPFRRLLPSGHELYCNHLRRTHVIVSGPRRVAYCFIFRQWAPCLDCGFVFASRVTNQPRCMRCAQLEEMRR